MSNYIAFSEGLIVPSDYVRVGRAQCPSCDAGYIISHFVALKDDTVVPDQERDLREILIGDHVDDNFKTHLPSYELD
jgi:hypothetical protein